MVLRCDDATVFICGTCKRVFRKRILLSPGDSLSAWSSKPVEPVGTSGTNLLAQEWWTTLEKASNILFFCKPLNWRKLKRIQKK